MTEPEATCVVERAKPSALEARIVAAVEVSAENPCAGFTSVRPLPSEEATPPVTKMCLVLVPFPTGFHHRAPDAAVANRRAGVPYS
mgnify:CR=1 FL=1